MQHKASALSMVRRPMYEAHERSTRIKPTTDMANARLETIMNATTTQKLPALFLSHGSPMMAIDDSPARRFLLDLGRSLPRPKAIIMVSAHWETLGGHAVSLATQPETIHDFGGFSPALYEIQYPAPGAPEAAAHAVSLLEQAHFKVIRSARRGLDHGAWVPLRLMYPDADIAVAQVSLQRGGSPADHERMGRALAAMREQGVLIIGSGSLTHNLYEFRGGPIDAPVPSWVSEFDDWIHDKLQSGQGDQLLDYRSLAPYAVRNHPSDEHLLPLFVAMGAAQDDSSGRPIKAERLHSSYEYSVLAMDTYAFS